jgi:hypothetical protein
MCKLATNSEGGANSEEKLYEEGTMVEEQICYVPVTSDSWHYEMKYYLMHGHAPHYLEPRKWKALGLKSSKYQLVEKIIFRRNYDDVLLRCLEKDDADRVLSELHDGPTGGHLEET